jgi:uncharacterized membrane protein
LVVPLVCGSAIAAEEHKLALQISDNDREKMNAVLNVAANVSKYYSDKGEEVARSSRLMPGCTCCATIPLP